MKKYLFIFFIFNFVYTQQFFELHTSDGNMYVCEMIQEGKKILHYPIAEMRGLGTPEDLTNFLSNINKKTIATES